MQKQTGSGKEIYFQIVCFWLIANPSETLPATQVLLQVSQPRQDFSKINRPPHGTSPPKMKWSNRFSQLNLPWARLTSWATKKWRMQLLRVVRTRHGPAFTIMGQIKPISQRCVRYPQPPALFKDNTSCLAPGSSSNRLRSWMATSPILCHSSIQKLNKNKCLWLQKLNRKRLWIRLKVAWTRSTSTKTHPNNTITSLTGPSTSTLAH